MDVVKPPYDELVAAWKGLRRTHALRVREVACVGAPRTLLVVERGTESLPTVMLSSGMHGDEPAAPWALLSLAADRLLDDRFAYRMWPCINPSGYAAGTRANAEGQDVHRSFSRGGLTPESRAIITANRDRRFALSVDLHEDFEAGGFYGFEPLAPGAQPHFAAAAVATSAGLRRRLLGTTVRRAGWPWLCPLRGTQGRTHRRRCARQDPPGCAARP